MMGIMGKKTSDMTPEEIAHRRAQQKKYREAHREELREYHRQKYAANRERYANTKRDWYLRNRDGQLAKARVRYQADKPGYSARNRSYREAHPGRKMLNGAVERTRRLGLPECDLTIEYIESIIPGRCPILDIPLAIGVGKPQPNSPSLDRINPVLGYVRGNVQVISNKANMMKQDATWAELQQFANWVLNNRPC